MSLLIDNFSNRLRYAITIKNIKPIELSRITGISKTNISCYMSGKYEAKQDGVKLLADALNVDPVWLMGYDVPMERNLDTNIQEINFKDKAPSFENNSNKQAFPLLGTVKAGYDYLANENIIGYVSIDKNINDVENCYALKITGDSMQPILYEDDIIIVHKQDDVESGQVAIILIDNDEATVKKIIKYNDYIELIAFNSYYPPKRLTNTDNFKIIGKVIEGRISKIFE